MNKMLIKKALLGKLLGATAGATMGGISGYGYDKNKPVRGALLGILTGGAAGTAVGHLLAKDIKNKAAKLHALERGAAKAEQLAKRNAELAAQNKQKEEFIQRLKSYRSIKSKKK